MKTPRCCLFLLCYVYSISSFSQTIIHDYLLGSTSNIVAANGRFYDNGGKDGDIRNEHFITTLHGVKNIEIYFKKYKLPDGSLLKAYLGNDTLAPLVAAFHSYDKIWNIQGKDITLEYVPPVNNITTAMGFVGVVHEVPPPPPSPEGDGSRSQPASDCVGAIPLCQNTTAVALAGQYTDLGAVNDDNGSCYSGTGSGGSVWYSFQPQANGPLDFTITPTGSTDYDFVLWDITSGCGTGQRQQVSCNFSLYTGITGLSSVNCNEPNGSCTTNDCTTDTKGSDCNRFNRRPNVLTTHQYAVCINFYSGSNDGFTIQFKNEASSVNITDVTPPTILNATANSCPSASQFSLLFSEYIDCNTLQNSDLTLPGHTITITNNYCVNGTSNNIDVTVTPPLTTGTYTLHAQDILDLCGNNMNSNFNIVIGPAPTPTISSNVTTCKSPGFLGIGFTYSPASQTLTAGGGSFYQWSDGQIGSSITVAPTATTTYTVTVTQGACPATASVNVTVESAPVINIPDQTICTGGSVTLTASGGGTYQWYTNPTFLGNGTAVPGGTNASLTVSPTVNTTYRVVVTSPGGCVGKDDAAITIVTTGCCNATITPAGPYCSSYAPQTLTAGTTGGTWSGTGITNTATGEFSPAVSGVGTFKVYYTLTCGATDSTTIVVQACSPLTVCKETNGNVTVSGGIGPYTWERQTTSIDCSGCFGGNCIPFICPGVSVTNWTSFSTATTTAPGTLPIRVRDNTGTIINITTLASLPACSSICPTITINSSAIVQVKCNGQTNGSFTANATGGASPYTYVLKNGTATVYTFSNVSGAQNFTTLGAATYTVNVTDNNGCTGTSTVSVTQPAVLAVTIPVTTNTTCGLSNGSATINVTGGTTNYTYSWNNSGGTSSLLTNAAANTYTLTVTDANLCTASASATIANSIALSLAITPTNIGCGNVTGKAKVSSSTGSAPFSYIWNNGQTADSAINLTAGNYQVTVTDAIGCSSSATITITSTGTTPNVSISAPGTLNCTNTSVTVVASSVTPNTTFAWSGGITGANNTVTAPGNYSVTATEQGGCTASASVAVSQNATPPNVSVAIPALLNCSVTSVTLTAGSSTPNTTFAWSGGISGATNPVSSPGNYSVTATSSNGCTASASTSVSQDIAIPNVTAGADQVVSCSSSTATLSGNSSTAGVTYQWSGPGAISGGGTAASATVNVTGTYTLLVTNPTNGCTASDAALVTPSLNTPNVNAGPDQSLTCLVTNFTLTASSSAAGVTFAWSNGTNTASTTVTTANSYSVTVTDGSNGCIAVDQVIVTDSTTPPTADAGLNQFITCTNSTATLSATSTTSGVSFIWSNGANTAVTTVSVPNTYSLTVTNASNGCTATDQVTVTANTNAPNISAGSDALLTCTVTSVTLTATSSTPNATFVWSNGTASSNNTVSSPNTYTVTATDPVNGCTASDQADVTTSPGTVTADAGSDQLLTCSINSVTLNGTSNNANVSYTWSNGSITASTSVNTANTYTLTVTDLSNGCTAFDQVLVSANTTAPQVNAGADQSLPCGITTLTLTGISTSTGVTYLWSNGTNTATNAVSLPGTYSLTVTDPSNDCTAVDQVDVTANTNAPDVSLGPDAQLTCNAPSLQITATSTVSGLTYLWYTTAISQSIQVNTANTYSVTVTNPLNDCTAADNIIITSTGIPAVSAQVVNNPCPEVAVGAITTSVTNGTAPYQYLWSNGSTAANLSSLHGGTYTLTITDANGCTLNDSYVLTEGAGLQISNLEALDVSLGESIQIITTVSGAQGIVGYSWAPPVYLDCTDCSSPITSPSSDIIYTVTATDANNCSGTSQVTIHVTPDYGLFIPNAFTPDGDGNNDYWEIFGDKKIWKEMYVSIFNRWGEKIFESNNLNFKWDGTYKSALQSPQVFIYQLKITFINGYRMPLRKGSFTLLR